jgi:hypothetical protein
MLDAIMKALMKKIKVLVDKLPIEGLAFFFRQIKV